jgi:hypothetical protein
MGCDIHLHIEVKINGKWYHWSNPSIKRNYDLFALMADVRNYDNIKPISKAKGLPENITKPTSLTAKYWNVDGHDFSWLSVEEVIELKERYSYINPDIKPFVLYRLFNTWILGNDITSWYIYPEENILDIEDMRLVFWFDS